MKIIKVKESGSGQIRTVIENPQTIRKQAIAETFSFTDVNNVTTFRYKDADYVKCEIYKNKVQYLLTNKAGLISVVDFDKAEKIIHSARLNEVNKEFNVYDAFNDMFQPEYPDYFTSGYDNISAALPKVNADDWYSKKRKVLRSLYCKATVNNKKHFSIEAKWVDLEGKLYFNEDGDFVVESYLMDFDVVQRKDCNYVSQVNEFNKAFAEAIGNYENYDIAESGFGNLLIFLADDKALMIKHISNQTILSVEAYEKYGNGEFYTKAGTDSAHYASSYKKRKQVKRSELRQLILAMVPKFKQMGILSKNSLKVQGI
ncbi:hypothetical protein MA9V1_132 [Chryseobacterium phage MA9V-1]|nr:hypothetical protein MA9V1_132 [Chryseobacterium phage MA9V-1]